MNTSSKRQADYDGQAQGRHAVVLGGSLAGLLAARVLFDHFDEVTLIERDVLAEDYRYPATTGHGATLMTKFMHRYMNHVIALATESVAVRRMLLRAFSMMIPPTALFHPRVLFRVLLRVLKPNLRATSVFSVSLWWPSRQKLTTETQRTPR